MCAVDVTYALFSLTFLPALERFIGRDSNGAGNVAQSGLFCPSLSKSKVQKIRVNGKIPAESS